MRYKYVRFYSFIFSYDVEKIKKIDSSFPEKNKFLHKLYIGWIKVGLDDICSMIVENN